MTFFQLDIEPKDDASAALIHTVGHELQKALFHAKVTHGLTQQKLAELIGVDRATVNRCFSGHRNLTLRTLAELSWALGHSVHVDLKPDGMHAIECNFYVMNSSDFSLEDESFSTSVRIETNVHRVAA